MIDNKMKYCCKDFEHAVDENENVIAVDRRVNPNLYYINDTDLDHWNPIKYCPWCGVRLDKSYERMAGKS